MRTRTALGAVLVIAAASVGGVLLASPGSAANDGLDQVRSATAKYHNIDVATADGFTELKDAAGIACIDKAGAGGMGIHYVLGSRVGNPAENAGEPELVIYEPQKNGQMKLVAVEYVVVASDWSKAGHTAPPSLFGHTFTLVTSPNRYGLPDFFELHAWAWDHNKSGDFADYNPNVVC
jgi:hypothetical protein